MLTYDMQNRGDASLYEHLYMCIREDIEAGRIALGERLPSKRALAKHLGISVITVEGAYAQLVAEGYVNAVPRKGLFASFTGSPKTVSPKCAEEQMFHVKHSEGFSEALGLSGFSGFSEPSASSGASSLSAPADPAPASVLWADFTGATAARGLFPYKTWARTVREALSAESERSLLAASDPAGAPQLRRALANYLRGFRGMEVSPQQIVVGAGAQSLYALIIQLLGRGRAYAVENPGYPRLAHIYRSNDVRLACIPLDDEGVRVDALAASGASVVHCMPSHQFPIGLVTSASRRHELLQWAMRAQGDETNVSRETFPEEETCAGDTSVGGGVLADVNVDERRYIIEDDYDCEFRMAGRPIPSLQSIDEAECVIYTNTFTKSLGLAFRIGYMVLPNHLALRFHELLGFYSCTVGAIDQLALARFIESGEYERHVNRLRNRHRRVQDALIGGLRASSVGDMLRFVHVGAGLHFLMEVDIGESASSECACRTNHAEHTGRAERVERAIAERAREEGIALAPLSDYWLDSPETSFAGLSSCASLNSPSDSPLLDEYSPRVYENRLPTFVMNFAGIEGEEVMRVVETLAQVLSAIK